MKVVVLLVVLLMGLACGAREDRCVAAYASVPTHPLAYRSRRSPFPGADRIQFDEAPFRKLQTHGAELKAFIARHTDSLPEDKKTFPTEITLPGWPESRTGTLAAAAADFRAVADVFEDIRGRRFLFSETFIDDLANEALAKALKLLIAEGITVTVHHDPKRRETYLEITPEDSHPINSLAKRLRTNPLPLKLQYFPLLFIRHDFTAALTNSTDLLLPNSVILNKDTRDFRILHELRHWLNHLARSRGAAYALAGSSVAKSGHLPGMRDVYSANMWHDEPHAYFESAKQNLIIMMADLKLGAPVELSRLTEIIEFGYRVSYRAEAIARILLGRRRKSIEFRVDENGRGVAQVEYFWGRNRIQTRISLPTAERGSKYFENLKILNEQLHWMSVSAATTRERFDQAYKMLKAMSGEATMEGLKQIQSILTPVDYYHR